MLFMCTSLWDSCSGTPGPRCTVALWYLVLLGLRLVRVCFAYLSLPLLERLGQTLMQRACLLRFCHLRATLADADYQLARAPSAKTPRRTSRLSLSATQHVPGMRFACIAETSVYPMSVLGTWRGKPPSEPAMQRASPSRSSTAASVSDPSVIMRRLAFLTSPPATYRPVLMFRLVRSQCYRTYGPCLTCFERMRLANLGVQLRTGFSGKRPC